MPQLTDLLNKRKEGKFVKKSYRPWDLSGESSSKQDVVANQPNEIGPNLHPESNNEYLTPTSSPIESKERNEDKKTTQNEVKINRISAELGNTLENNLDNNKVTIRERLDNNRITIGEQLDNNKITIREQLDNEFSPHSWKNSLLKLSGLQGKIFTLITNICLSKGGCKTGPLDTAVLAKHVDATYGSTKTSLNRLIKKGFLVREQGKRAQGGYINLSISKEVMEAITDLKTRSQSPEILKSILLSTPLGLDNGLDNNLVYSSSNIKNTTTNQVNKNNSLPIEWQEINIEPLAHIGFSTQQLKQLVEYNTPEVVKESILHFAYALEHNPKYKDHGSPLNVIMGVLRKGQGWFEANYESHQDKALRELLEQRTRQKERREKLVQDFVSSGFDGWLATLSIDQIDEILPEEISLSKLQAPKTLFLKNYYKDNIVLPELVQKGYI